MALGGQRRQVVDVQEHLLGEAVQLLGADARIGAARGDPPPGEPRADPEGCEQHGQRPPLTCRAAPQFLDRVAPGGVVGPLRVLQARHEPLQRLLDPGLDQLHELPGPAPERVRVLGHLERDLGHHLPVGVGQQLM